MLGARTGSPAHCIEEMNPITTDNNETNHAAHIPAQSEDPGTVSVLINNINGLPHIYQVLGVALIGGAVTAFGYGLAQTEAAEAAAVLLTAFVLTFTRLIISFKPPKEDSDFAHTRTVVANFVHECQEFIKTRAVLGKAVIAFFSALMFLICRWAALFMFEYLANPWIALGAGALLTSIICSPVLWKAFKGSLGAKAS